MNSIRLIKICERSKPFQYLENFREHNYTRQVVVPTATSGFLFWWDKNEYFFKVVDVYYEDWATNNSTK